jgi:hypothetical protein
LQGDNITLAPQPNWEFDVTDPLSVTSQFFTDTTGQVVVCDLAPGLYTVTENVPQSIPFSVIGLAVNNIPLSPATSTSFSWSIGQPAVGVVFQNQTQSGGGPQ